MNFMSEISNVKRSPGYVRAILLPLGKSLYNARRNVMAVSFLTFNESPSTAMVTVCTLLLFSTYALQPSRLIVRSGLDIPTFATRRLHASPRESTQQRKVKLWARNVREFCLNANLHVTFRDLLHAVKLRHGTDGFISPLKEGVLRIFSP